MGLDISVKYDNLARSPSGNVKGKVTLNLKGDLIGINFDQDIDARNFDFPRGGQQAIYDQDFGINKFSAKVTASVHEHTAGQCCIQGHVHVSAPIGGGIGKDLDPNCQPIPG